MAQIDRLEETNRLLREEDGAHAETYKEWMRVQSSKKKQQRKYSARKQKNKEQALARQYADHEDLMQQQVRQNVDQMAEQYSQALREEEMGGPNDESPEYNPLRYKQ